MKNCVKRNVTIVFLFIIFWGCPFLPGIPPDETDRWQRVQKRLAAELPATGLHAQKPDKPFSGYLDGNFYYGLADRSISITLPAWERSKDITKGQKRDRVVPIGKAKKNIRPVSLQFRSYKFDGKTFTFKSYMIRQEEDYRNRHEKETKRTATKVVGQFLQEFTFTRSSRVTVKDVFYAGFPGKKIIVSIDGGDSRLAGLLKFGNLGFLDISEITRPRHPEIIMACFEFPADSLQKYGIQICTMGKTYYRPEIPFPPETLIDKIMRKAATILADEFSVKIK